MTAKTITGVSITFPIIEPRMILGLIVTPELATYFLEFSEDKFQNRAINDARVNKYGQDMQAGRWKHNGQTIIFDNRGVLVDGYTRCSAAFSFNVNFITDVRTGVEEDALTTIDTGRSRTLSNALAIIEQGGQAPTALGQGINWLYRYINGMINDNWRQISHSVALDFLKLHPGLYDSIPATATARNKRLASPGVLVASHYICHTANPVKCDEFFEMLASGVGYTTTSPIRHLRERLMSRAERRAKGAEHFAWILHVWNKFIAGEQVRVLKLPAEMPVVKGFERKQEKVNAQAKGAAK